MREGFAIGFCLIMAGLVLQLSIGPVSWDVFRWPVNGVMLVCFLALIAILFLLRKKVYAFQFIGSSKSAVPALVYAVVLTVIMGLTRQKSLTPGPSQMDEGSLWINSMLNFWPFVLIYVYIAVILGLVVLRQVSSFRFQVSGFRFPVSTLSHLGLFLALTSAALGSADVQRVKMIVEKGGQEEWRAMNQRGQTMTMPIAIGLKDFVMETYDDGKPKRFASDIFVRTKTERRSHAIVEVNKPIEVEGWRIYQYGYDTQMGAMSQISILELIRDPWLPLVYTGIYMMLAGAVLMILRVLPWRQGVQQARKHPKTALLLCVVIAVCFFCVHHFMPILHSDTLVPALQSPWFKPHIIAYMLAYTLMGTAAVVALYLLFFKKAITVSSIVGVGLAFLTIGMLFGALWAKEAWGHYWSWDPKETWAAITWFAYLVYVHYRLIPTHRRKVSLLLLLVSFMLLQMCWWGINYLPSAQGSSVHVYSR